MAVFPMCWQCEREYHDPTSRRFHAQANACARCGPVVRLLGPDGAEVCDTDPVAAAARLLLDQHFTPALSEMICAAVGLDLPVLEAPRSAQARLRRPRASGFAEEVLRAYAYQCAMCGFDGRLGRNPVAIEAAHARWHSQDGPDDLANAVALCSLHHALFDCGVLGLRPDLQITVKATATRPHENEARPAADECGSTTRSPWAAPAISADTGQ